MRLHSMDLNTISGSSAASKRFNQNKFSEIDMLRRNLNYIVADSYSV